MDNLRVLRQVYDECDAERVMAYDKLSRTLNNLDLAHDPVNMVRGYIAQIANLEHQQEVAVGFMNQIQEDLKRAAESDDDSDSSEDDENQE